MGRLGTQAEYADHLGCKPPYVTKLKAQGRLRLVDTEAGLRVDFDASDAAIAASRDAAKEGVRERWARERLGSTARAEAAAVSAALAGRPNPANGLDVDPVPASAETAPSGQDRASRELYEARLRAQIRTEQARAQVAELELLERAGALVRAVDVQDAMMRHGRAVNQMVLTTLVPRLAQLVAPHVSEAQQLQTLRSGMESEAKVVLNELASRVAAESGTDGEAHELETA